VFCAIADDQYHLASMLIQSSS